MRKNFLKCGSLIAVASGLVLASAVFAPAPAEAAQTFNVKNFGATGNGSTDDTTGILAAFAEANAVQGSTILFPQGNYVFSNQLTVTGTGVSVVGQHATLTSENSSAELLLRGNRESVQSITFAGQASDAIFVEGATGFTVERNTVNPGIGIAIFVDESSNGVIASNNITMSNSSAFVVEDSNLVAIQSNLVGTIGSNTTFIDFGDSNNISIVSNRVTAGVLGSGGALSTIGITHNVFNYVNEGLDLGDVQNLTISDNQFIASTSNANHLLVGDDQNVLISNNTFKNGSLAIEAGDCTNLQISGNTVNNTQGDALELGGNTSVIVSRNTITQALVAVALGGVVNLSVTGNQIAQCQQQAIDVSGCAGTNTIFNNEIRSCGLSSTVNPPAVIFVDSPGATSIPITHNSYTGNTSNLQFFIRCEQASPPAQVSGNSTNTGLPTVVGP